jgi:hypothetical protein
MLKVLYIALINLIVSKLYCQISFIPKVGFEYSGIGYYPKGSVKYEDIIITIPDGEMFLSCEVSLLNRDDKYSFLVERMNLGEGVKIIRDSVFYSNGFIGYGQTRMLTGREILFLGFHYDKINKPIKNTWLSYFYGAGIGIGFNKTAAYYREVQDAGYSSAFWGGDNPINIQRWAIPTGHGFFLKLRGGLTLMNKKKREALILEFFWRQGLKKMIEYTVDYSYSSNLRPSYGHTVRGYRFNNRGTTFGTTLGFPIYLASHFNKKKQ